MRVVEVRDVTKEAVRARDEDKRRVDAFVDQCIDTFHAFKIPFVGPKKRLEAEQVFKNFCRNPGTKLYENMVDGTDTYKVVIARKCA
jgi:hypothetical protein